MPFSAGFLTGLLPSDPVAWVQAGVIASAVVLIYLLLFTLRDILLRTRSFWYQFFCVLLVGCLPIVGFFLYLLIRPARTVKQRELESVLQSIGLLPDDGYDLDSEEADDAEDLVLSSDSSDSSDS